MTKCLISSLSGRGSNSWLSPVGCMMFSLVVTVSSSSVIGQRLPYLQHVVAVAIVHSIREKQGYEVYLPFEVFSKLEEVRFCRKYDFT